VKPQAKAELKQLRRLKKLEPSVSRKESSMKNAVLIIIILGAFFFCAESSSPASAQTVSTDTSSEISSVTLYAALKYRDGQGREVFDFQRGARPASSWGRWDLGYGFLYAGNDFDWLQSSSARGHRSVIRDLGQHDWTDNFAVPEVALLAKLKPGEQRQINVATSGDGADAAGRPKLSADDVFSRVLPERHNDGPIEDVPQPSKETAPAARPKRDGRTKTPSLSVKAIVGHVYVIHVVDDLNDFYALFRVEALERGDNCTISWKRITAPTASAKAK
jgi:hypothetical protein